MDQGDETKSQNPKEKLEGVSPGANETVFILELQRSRRQGQQTSQSQGKCQGRDGESQ